MATGNKIDSSSSGLRVIEEASNKVLPALADQTWTPLEPNSYGDFGGTPTLTPRTPITFGRQREKGGITDFEAVANFNTDLTQSNLQDLLQGFFFSTLRTKAEVVAPVVDGPNDEFEPAAGGDDYFANDLLFAKGFDDAANNGLHLVTGTPAAAAVEVTSTLTAATSQTGIISRVGHQFADGDLTVDVSTGDLPRLVSAAKNPTQLGIIPGEFIFVGGDLVAEQFPDAVNNGWKRVRSVTATYIELDKSDSDMVVDADTTGLTIRIFVGRALKNENGTETANPIVCRSYQFERILGAPDSANPTQFQAQYVLGAIPNTFNMNISPGTKLEAELGFVATDSTVIAANAITAIKSELAEADHTGGAPTLVSEDLINTAEHFARVRIGEVSSTDESTSALFAFLEEATLEIDNGVTLAKAIGVRGGFDAVTSDFAVGGSLTAYFADVAAVNAVNNNSDITLDFAIAVNNAGMAFDLPLLALGDGRPTVEKDEAIKLPLSMEAARATRVATTFDHTLFAVFFDYLPTLAQN